MARGDCGSGAAKGDCEPGGGEADCVPGVGEGTSADGIEALLCALSCAFMDCSTEGRCRFDG